MTFIHLTKSRHSGIEHKNILTWYVLLFCSKFTPEIILPLERVLGTFPFCQIRNGFGVLLRLYFLPSIHSRAFGYVSGSQFHLASTEMERVEDE